MKTRLSLVFALPVAFALAGCPKDSAEANEEPLTSAEAKEALTEASASSQAAEFVATDVELSTNFTVGAAVEKAVEELRSFVVTQLPCAEATVDSGTLTVNYGAKGGNCTYRGHSFSGSSSIKITKNEGGQVVLARTWTDFSNGVVKVNGTADVTWSAADRSRNVKHDLRWTRIADNREGRGTGDRTEKALPGGVLEGIRIDGARSWETAKGKWDLAIDGVEVRWTDPVPQAGKYVLVTPNKKSLSMTFSRVDADSILVKIEGPKKSFQFTVNKLGTDIRERT
jgi:hypothetical protein